VKTNSDLFESKGNIMESWQWNSTFARSRGEIPASIVGQQRGKEQNGFYAWADISSTWQLW
jgi:hypothetical protein